MALVPCRECQKKISENAVSCPECGAPFPSRREWRGPGFEWKSQKTLFGHPLIHIAFGRNEKGKLRVAKGFIAIGQFAVGAFTVAQFGIGLIFGLGQFIFGLTAVAQIAITALFGCGQVAIGYVAVGQLVFGYYGLAQVGIAKYLWSFGRKDPEALDFFSRLGEKIGLSLDQYFRK
ncbi:zinc ribbon domain-containing protein [bacterium]|nr:zinc ribbon domain-containing protein [bacterium]